MASLRGLLNRFLRLFGSGNNHASSVDSTLAYVRRDDPEMGAAWEQARASVDQFIALLDDPAYAEADFYVKKRFDEDERSEHIWLGDVRVEGREFVGSVGNDPRIVTHVKFGSEARVTFDEISDWMITQGEEMEGGFTVELLMQRRANQ